MNLDDLNVTIDGAALLDELHDAVGRYVIFPSAAAHDAVTLLIAATHAQPAWEHAPRGAFVSPDKRCGKSRLLDVFEATCHKPMMTVNVSPAALVRSITADDPPTILIDEADTIFGSRKAAENHEDIRGIVNAGHQRNRPYIRWDITTRSPEHCPTYAMAILAAIGGLPDTIMDRAVVIRMRRRARGESVDPYRTRRDAPALHAIRDRLSAWIRPHLEDLSVAQPDMPVEDREADTWEPLIAIADLAGGVWPERGRRACLALVAEAHASDGEDSEGTRLLADIRDIFSSEESTTFMPSRNLVQNLKDIDDAPWSDAGLTMSSLSRKLRPYGVKPGPDRTRTTRGYAVADFADAFARYLPSRTVQASTHASEQGGFTDGSTCLTCPSTCPDESVDSLVDTPGTHECPGKTADEQSNPDSLTTWDSMLAHVRATASEG